MLADMSRMPIFYVSRTQARKLRAWKHTLPKVYQDSFIWDGPLKAD